MDQSTPPVVGRVKVREVAGVFQSRSALEDAVDELLLAGFDRADIDLMAGFDAVREKLGIDYIAATELADVPGTLRRAFIPRYETAGVAAGAAGLLFYVGATAAALAVAASGGALAVALAAAAVGGAAGGGLGLVMARKLGEREVEELHDMLEAGGLVVWVRVREPEREGTAQLILRKHGAQAVRVHEIELEKRLEDLPLAQLRPDPWLGDEPLAKP